jgi:PAC2 family protein
LPYPAAVPLIRVIDDLPELSDPVMVASFDGWVDAAEAGSRAVAHLAEHSVLIADFEPDAVFDFRSRRPVLDVMDGRLSDLRWPELTIRHARAGERDLLVFSGAEPDFRWQELCTDVVELAGRMRVSQWVSLGAVPAAVPHTRRVPVMTTASQDGLLAPGEISAPEGLLRVPSAALSAFEMAVVESGIPSVGFYAQVPPYASIGYTAASIALLDRLAGHLEIPLDLNELVEEERDQRARYDAAADGDPILRDTVAQLESVTNDEESEQLPTGDELAREIERFLRGQAEPGD